MNVSISCSLLAREQSIPDNDSFIALKAGIFRDTYSAAECDIKHVMYIKLVVILLGGKDF
jgi:hypothetical protein